MHMSDMCSRSTPDATATGDAIDRLQGKIDLLYILLANTVPASLAAFSCPAQVTALSYYTVLSPTQQCQGIATICLPAFSDRI